MVSPAFVLSSGYNSGVVYTYIASQEWLMDSNISKSVQYMHIHWKQGNGRGKKNGSNERVKGHVGTFSFQKCLSSCLSAYVHSF